MFFEIIKNPQFDFVGKFKFTSIISLILVAGCVWLAATKMQYGVDFRGGAEIQIKFSSETPLETVRAALTQSGFGNAVVQTIGDASENEYLVKVVGDESNLNQVTDEVSDALKGAFTGDAMEIRKVDIVGPKAGAQLRLSGFQAMFWALLAIMIYVGLRFEFKYAPGAIVATFHDVAIVLGIYALTGTEFTLQTVAAILAVIGYSVNDTVVIYDRVREFENMDARSLPQVINEALNSTLSRTLLTSLTTLFVSQTMFLAGGPAVHDFFLALTVGVVVGSYSSLFVAAPVALFFDRMQRAKAQKSATA
jgi:preprotein translocase subunit SecF